MAVGASKTNIKARAISFRRFFILANIQQGQTPFNDQSHICRMPGVFGRFYFYAAPRKMAGPRLSLLLLRVFRLATKAVVRGLLRSPPPTGRQSAHRVRGIRFSRSQNIDKNHQLQPVHEISSCTGIFFFAFDENKQFSECFLQLALHRFSLKF
jgi:hypothetical protein